MKTPIRNNKTYLLLTIAISSIGLSACSGVETEAKYPTGAQRNTASGNDIYEKQTGIFGKDGLVFGKKKKAGAGESGIGVNSFLWRATLDTVSFMPLASADPFGGVILTDWYTDPNTPNERVKINAFILGRELKASGIKIKTFRQKLSGNNWQDVATSEDTNRKLEDAILTRARELRIRHLAEK